MSNCTCPTWAVKNPICPWPDQTERLSAWWVSSLSNNDVKLYGKKQTDRQTRKFMCKIIVSLWYAVSIQVWIFCCHSVIHQYVAVLLHCLFFLIYDVRMYFLASCMQLWCQTCNMLQTFVAQLCCWATSCTSDVGCCRVAQQVAQQKSKHEHALFSATCCGKAKSCMLIGQFLFMFCCGGCCGRLRHAQMVYEYH